MRLLPKTVALGLLAHLSMWANSVTVEDILYTGNGCPADSALVVISPDAQKMYVLFDAFQVTSGVQIGALSAEKTCNVSIKIKTPKGLSAAIVGIDYAGFSHLSFGTVAQVKSQHWLNQDLIAESQHTLYGNTTGKFAYVTAPLGPSLLWSPCTNSLNVKSTTRLHVHAPNHLDHALASVDGMGQEAGITYRLVWRACAVAP